MTSSAGRDVRQRGSPVGAGTICRSEKCKLLGGNGQGEARAEISRRANLVLELRRNFSVDRPGSAGRIGIEDAGNLRDALARSLAIFGVDAHAHDFLLARMLS